MSSKLFCLMLLVSITSFSVCRQGPPDDGRLAPLFEAMGDYQHKVTVSSDMAQKYFDQGLKLIYGFNHAEAVRSFQEVARRDSNCAMAYWGIAFALGPNINKPMDDKDVPAAYDAAQKAVSLASTVSPVEQAYIAALAKRYAPEPVPDRQALDRAFADAMRQVSEQYPDDLDAATLFAESLMDLIPWAYYNEDGTPKPETVEIIASLERVMASNPNHPGANHYYIHAVEASSTPERGEPAADRLGDLVPDAGHLVHMPSHIYLRIGRYHDATAANEKAAAADESYISQCNAQGFYPALYYPHNIHFLWFTSAMEGRGEVSINAARRLVKNVAVEQIKEHPSLESFRPIPYFALARFGKWQEILALPQPPQEFYYETAMWHYARGLALAGQGDVEHAAQEADKLKMLAASAEIEALEQPFYFGASLTGIATDILSAKVAGLRAKNEEMLTLLRKAVVSQDALPYMEPPYWYYPIRQTLGAALVQAGQPAEAEVVFREDLERNRGNGWSLYGLEESLRALGKEEAADSVHAMLKEKWVLADIAPDLRMY